MARNFTKYTSLKDIPESIIKSQEQSEQDNKKVIPEKTLRHHHNAIKMADVALYQEQSPKMGTQETELNEEEAEPDQDMMMASMMYLIKGLRGMMQIAGRAK